MPLSSLSPLITTRFQEVLTLFSVAASLESSDPHIPDTDEVRALRGLLYVHMYAAFEYAMSEAFIRLAQHVSSKNVERKHIQPPVFSAALDPEFKSLESVRVLEKRMRKRIETINCTRDKSPVAIPDTILSERFQSADPESIALAFDVYGIPDQPLYDMAAKGYIKEVVERRHAVAHGRESAAVVGVVKVAELRKRYDALYAESIYVINTLNRFCGANRYILTRYRRKYT